MLIVFIKRKSVCRFFISKSLYAVFSLAKACMPLFLFLNYFSHGLFAALDLSNAPIRCFISLTRHLGHSPSTYTSTTSKRARLPRF